MLPDGPAPAIPFHVGEHALAVPGKPSQAPISAGSLTATGLPTGCQIVLQGDTELWRRCDGLMVTAFSPDGRYLAAWHTATGGEFESAYIMDARTGRRVTDTAAASPTTFPAMTSGAMAWEDPSHLLNAFRDGLTRDRETVRLGVDGRLTLTTSASPTTGPHSRF